MLRGICERYELRARTETGLTVRFLAVSQSTSVIEQFEQLPAAGAIASALLFGVFIIYAFMQTNLSLAGALLLLLLSASVLVDSIASAALLGLLLNWFTLLPPLLAAALSAHSTILFLAVGNQPD